MKLRMILFVLSIMLISPHIITAGLLEDFLNIVQQPAKSSRDEGTVISGLKEALSVGTDSAVKLVGKENGYFGSEAIKIPLPENIEMICKVLRKAGMGKDVDAFILSMNRAAEKAAPQAKAIFIGAIKEMSFQDAAKILNGGNTAATDYFKIKTSSHLAEVFKPEISSSMNHVGVTQKYKVLTQRYLSLIPFAKKDAYDLDQYVTNKSLDGLFYMVGEEEKKIRTNPAARTTEILKKVFGEK